MKVAARDPPKDSEIERCLCAAIKKDSLDSVRIWNFHKDNNKTS